MVDFSSSLDLDLFPTMTIFSETIFTSDTFLRGTIRCGAIAIELSSFRLHTIFFRPRNFRQSHLADIFITDLQQQCQLEYRPRSSGCP